MYCISLRRSKSSCFGAFIGFLLSLALFMPLFEVHSAEVDIESVIPTYSAACVIVRDASKIMDGIKSSPEWQSFISHQSPQIETEKAARFSKIKSTDLLALLGAFVKRVALVQISPEALWRPTIIAELRDPTKGLEDIERILGEEKGYELQRNLGNYLDVPFGLIKPSIRYTFIDNLLVIAPEQDALEAVIDVYLGREPSINDDPKFHMAVNKVSSDSGIFIYINLEMANPIVQNLIRRTDLQILGVNEISAVSWTIDPFTPEKSQEIYAYTADSDGLLTSLFADPKPLFSPHLIPVGDSEIFCAMHLGDPALLWDKIMIAQRAIMSKEEFAQMQNAVSEFEREIGLNLRNDILSSLSGEVGFAVTFPKENMGILNKPEFSLGRGLIVFYGVKDSEKFSMVIERLLSHLQIQQAEYKGVRVHYLPSVVGPEGPVGYIFAGDMLVFGGLMKLQSLIDEEPPLIVSEDFAQIGSQLSPPYGLIFYVDLGKLFPQIQVSNPKPLGSLGGSVAYDGEGLKIKLTGTKESNWLEIAGCIANSIAQMFENK